MTEFRNTNNFDNFLVMLMGLKYNYCQKSRNKKSTNMTKNLFQFVMLMGLKIFSKIQEKKSTNMTKFYSVCHVNGFYF